jgi:Mg-chelatase subunit ChlD
VLITDGRANISLRRESSPMVEVKELAALFPALGVSSLILDTEPFAPCLDLGCLPELSRIMNGCYHSIRSLRAPDVVARVSAVLR